MSAGALQVDTLEIPDPIYFDPRTSNAKPEFVNQNLGYNWQSSEIVTLSTTAADTSPTVGGLLYVPDLTAGDPCINASAPYIHANVTRQSNLPPTYWNTIAIAPWLSSQCTLSYLAATRGDQIRAFVFFLPTNTTAAPPPADAPDWDLGDGGAWKTQNRYPVYAISGLDGLRLTLASAQYSGNITYVPYGDQLVSQYDPRSYIRLWLTIFENSGASFPSLWVFLLIVLGILLAIIAATSVLMHIVHRRRRESLRRRIASGEVNLETLGIKRFTVSQSILDRMPLYTYGTGAPATLQGDVANRDAFATTVEKERDDVHVNGNIPLAHHALTQPAAVLDRTTSTYQPTPLSQPTCAICLDDFTLPSAENPDGTMVRELPCHHIFHPECVDSFLRDSSSLCPLCKKSTLPAGYAPRNITNAMVRRERLLRRIRERVPRENNATREDEAGNSSRRTYRGSSFAERLRTRLGTFSSIPRATGTHGRATRRGSEGDASSRPEQEMVTVVASSPRPLEDACPDSARPPTHLPRDSPGRREWARRRALAMLGRRAPMDLDEEEARRTPSWRKAINTVFPGTLR